MNEAIIGSMVVDYLNNPADTDRRLILADALEDMNDSRHVRLRTIDRVQSEASQLGFDLRAPDGLRFPVDTNPPEFAFLTGGNAAIRDLINRKAKHSYARLAAATLARLCPVIPKPNVELRNFDFVDTAHKICIVFAELQWARLYPYIGWSCGATRVINKAEEQWIKKLLEMKQSKKTTVSHRNIHRVACRLARWAPLWRYKKHIAASPIEDLDNGAYPYVPKPNVFIHQLGRFFYELKPMERILAEAGFDT
jgi:hypothetical protein